MPQNPFPYSRTVVEDFTPGSPGSGTDVLATHHNTQDDAAAYLANAIPLFKVDPNDIENCFADLAAAWAVLDAALASGVVARLLLADGNYSAAVNFGTRPFVIDAVNPGQAIISGALTFGSSASKVKRTIRGVELDQNTLNIADGCDLDITNCYSDRVAFSLDPTAGSVGWIIRVSEGSWDQATVSESASSSGPRSFIIENTAVYFNATLSKVFSFYDTDLHLHNISTLASGFGILTDATNLVFDSNSDDGEIHFDGVSLLYSGTAPIFGSGASAKIFAEQCKFSQIFVSQAFNFGSAPTGFNAGFIEVVADVAPIGAPVGTRYFDSGNNRAATYVFDYWKWDSWKIGEALLDNGLGDPTASTGAFGIINDAYNALTAALGTEQPMFLKLVNGLDYTLAGGVLTIGNGRSVHISTLAPEHYERDRVWDTRVVGDITLAAADAASERLVFGISGVVLDGDINGNSNWHILLNHFLHDSGHIINRIHGTNGCSVLGSHFRSTGGAFQIIDTGSSSEGKVVFEDSHISFGFSSNVCFAFAGAIVGSFKNCAFDCFSIGSNAMFDFANAACNVSFYDCTILPFISGTLSVVVNGGSGTVLWVSSSVQVTDGGSFDPTAGSTSGRLIIFGDTEPANKYAGLQWTDTAAYVIKIWNGAAWVVPGASFFRAESNSSISISNLATVQTPTLFTIPAGYSSREHRIDISGSMYRTNNTTMTLQFSMDAGANWHNIHTAVSPVFGDQNNALKFKYQLFGRGHGAATIIMGWADFFLSTKTIQNCYKSGGAGFTWGNPILFRMELIDTGNATNTCVWSLLCTVFNESS